jgi:phenylalanine-4-hydroxylase
VPLLFDAAYADHIQAYGQGALKAHALENGPQHINGAVEMLARLYWYTIEFGLLREGPQGACSAYGAGILSSAGELRYSILGDSHGHQAPRAPLRTTDDLLRCMASTYKIDSYQSQYFVIDSFAALLALTAPDFTPLYRSLTAPTLPSS